MGDRAYVRITCRREDAERFGQLGFVEDSAEGDIAVSMVDEEANYAHYFELTGWPRPALCSSAGTMRVANTMDRCSRQMARANTAKCCLHRMNRSRLCA